MLGDVRIGVDEGELFGQLYPDLHRFAAVAAPPGVDPDDLIQEAVARTLRRQRLTELRDPAVYLRVVVVRLASNERRRQGRAGRAANRLVPERASFDALGSALSDLLRLSPEDRAVVYMTVVEDMSTAEVAARIGTSQAAVRMRRRRALRRLRQHLIDDEREGE